MADEIDDSTYVDCFFLPELIVLDLLSGRTASTVNPEGDTDEGAMLSMRSWKLGTTLIIWLILKEIDDLKS